MLANETTTANFTNIVNEFKLPGIGPITWDDATWILTSAFIIFTMQSGFGLLEAGAVSSKSEVNIMVKNAVDVLFGGISYWAFGYALSFGKNKGSNPFCGIGYFFVDTLEDDMGIVFSTFVFQLSFATTATTIVSGAMAERTKLSSYIVFSFTNTIIYCIPAHWVWGSNGFLRSLGCVDIAGSGVVHLLGGTSALVAAYILKPRLGRYDNGSNALPLGNPTNAIIGMFMLWWGWLGFNCGSTFGISGGKWKLAAKSAATTLNASMGGGIFGVISRCLAMWYASHGHPYDYLMAFMPQNRDLLFPALAMLFPNYHMIGIIRSESTEVNTMFAFCYILKKGKLDVSYLINSVLGSLVSITAGCAVIRPWESVIVGFFGGSMTIAASHFLDIIHIDDPVSAVAVHGAGGLWGMLACGLFVDVDLLEDITQGQKGIFYGGGVYLLGIQLLTSVCIILWSGFLTFLMLSVIQKTIGLRLDPEEEILGSDFVEHNVILQHSSSVLFHGHQASSLALTHYHTPPTNNLGGSMDIASISQMMTERRNKNSRIAPVNN